MDAIADANIKCTSISDRLRRVHASLKVTNLALEQAKTERDHQTDLLESNTVLIVFLPVLYI